MDGDDFVRLQQERKRFRIYYTGKENTFMTFLMVISHTQ
jgi:hypothetical protein